MNSRGTGDTNRILMQGYLGDKSIFRIPMLTWVLFPRNIIKMCIITVNYSIAFQGLL